MDNGPGSAPAGNAESVDPPAPVALRPGHFTMYQPDPTLPCPAVWMKTQVKPGDQRWRRGASHRSVRGIPGFFVHGAVTRGRENSVKLGAGRWGSDVAAVYLQGATSTDVSHPHRRRLCRIYGMLGSDENRRVTHRIGDDDGSTSVFRSCVGNPTRWAPSSHPRDHRRGGDHAYGLCKRPMSLGRCLRCVCRPAPGATALPSESHFV